MVGWFKSANCKELVRVFPYFKDSNLWIFEVVENSLLKFFVDKQQTKWYNMNEPEGLNLRNTDEKDGWNNENFKH